jgi:RNA polymerase primary sigma factor
MLYLKKFKTFGSKLKKEVNQMSTVLLQKEGFWEGDNLPPRLLPQEEKRLFQRLEINSGDKKVKDEIVESNTRLVRSWAKKIKNSYSTFNLELEDLCQTGVIGLMKAADKYQWRKGFKFSTYSRWWIKQAITRTIGNQGRKDDTISLDKPLSGDEEDNPLIDFTEDKKINSPLVEVEEENIREKLRESLLSLSPRERKILAMRFGLEDGKCFTLEEVGVVLGITKERVRQIQKRALRKLSQNPQLRLLK